MKSKTHCRPLLVLLSLLTGVPLASAQTAPDPVPAVPAPLPAAVNVSMKLDVVAWGDNIQGLRIKSGGKEIPLTAIAFEYSKAVAYSGANILEIMQGPGAAPAANSYATPDAKAPATPADPKAPLSELDKRRKDNPAIVALAYLPAGSTRVTVLIAPAAGGTYQTCVIDDDPTKLPLGKLRIHNYCSIPIAVRCNRKETAELKTKEAAVVSPMDDNVIYELAYRKDDKWKMQENNIIKVEPTEQVQLVVLKSDASFFASGDGSRGGFLQTVLLRRGKKQMTDDATVVEGQPPR